MGRGILEQTQPPATATTAVRFFLPYFLGGKITTEQQVDNTAYNNFYSEYYFAEYKYINKYSAINRNYFNMEIIYFNMEAEVIIEMDEKQIAIWDKNCDQFKDRMEKEKVWIAICNDVC